MPARNQLTEARRTQLLEAATRVICERGLWDTRITDVAEEAGASSALVIYYFGTKDRLLAEALTFSEDRFYADTDRELATEPDARLQLTRLVELSCSSERDGRYEIDEWALWVDLWSRALRDPEVAKQREALDARWRALIAAIVRRGQEQGAFGPADPGDFAIRFAALIDGLAIQVVLEDPAMNVERMFHMAMRTAALELGFELPDRPRATGRRSAGGRQAPRLRPRPAGLSRPLGVAKLAAPAAGQAR